MKITDVKTLCLSRMHDRGEQWVTAKSCVVKADCAIVVIETDGGLQGIGEASAYGTPSLIREKIEWLKKDLTGKDPCDPATALSPNGLGRTYDAAASGIDCALWDLRGKASGKQVAELLTDSPLKKIRLYASSGCRYDWRKRPEQLIDETLGHLEEGYTACKVRIGTDWSWDEVTPERFLVLMGKLAEAVDGRLELMVDGNQRLTEPEAMEIALELDRLGFAWFEEPIPRANLQGYVRLCRAVDMPITGGEGMTTLDQFQPYLESGAYDTVQPDAGLCGITEGLRIGRMAHQYGVLLCPHNWHNGLMTMANAHLVAALPVPKVLELCQIQGPLQWGILKERPVIREGYLELPARPGLGVELAAGLESDFPYIEGAYAITIQR